MESLFGRILSLLNNAQRENVEDGALAACESFEIPTYLLGIANAEVRREKNLEVDVCALME